MPKSLIARLGGLGAYASAAALVCLAIGQAAVQHDYAGAAGSVLAASGLLGLRARVAPAVEWVEVVVHADLDGDGKVGPA